MSLRQRGQRPSESTNEGGSGGGGGGVYTNSSPSSSSYGGGGYGYGASPAAVASSGVNTSNPYGNVGGYFGASTSPSSSGSGYNTSPTSSAVIGGGGGAAVANNNYAANASSLTTGYGGGGYSNNYPVASPYAASAGYPAAGYGGGGGGYNTPGYGGYSGNPSSTTTTTSSANPFHKSIKSSSSSFFNLGSITSNILPLLLGLTICTLTATTFHFRHSMQQIQTQIEHSKQTMEQHHQRVKQTQQSNREKMQQQMEQEKKTFLEANHRMEEQIKTLQIQREGISNRHSTSMKELNELETEKQSMLKKIDHTKYALEDVAYELEKYTSMLEGKAEVEVIAKKREKALWNVVERLEAKIGRESWREAEEWFGPGPHKVEIQLEYPRVNNVDPPSKWPRIRNKIVIEMAPLDLMPHSVNLFLQQVHHGLWDGNELTTNADHIMSFGYHRASAHQGFVDRALETVSFQEYSHKYPHLQWTVGFMGRPSGPDFYINKVDNSITHGPGGQAHLEDMHNEADPCFGKVVEGFDVLNDINAIPVDKEHDYELSYPVTILSARVIAQRNNDSFGNQGGGDGRGGAWQGVEHGRKFDEADEIMPLPADEIRQAP